LQNRALSQKNEKNEIIIGKTVDIVRVRRNGTADVDIVTTIGGLLEDMCLARNDSFQEDLSLGQRWYSFITPKGLSNPCKRSNGFFGDVNLELHNK
jgi:hypothetical protein